MAVIAIPKILNDRLTDEGARALVEILDKVEHNSTQHDYQSPSSFRNNLLVTSETTLQQLQSIWNETGYTDEEKQIIGNNEIKVEYS